MSTTTEIFTWTPDCCGEEQTIRACFEGNRPLTKKEREAAAVLFDLHHRKKREGE